MIKPIAKVTDIVSAIDKKEKGAYAAEWQILDRNKHIVDDIMDIIPVSSVHTSLMNGQDVEIDKCLVNDYVNIASANYHCSKLNDAFMAAEYCGDYQNRKVTVVAHLSNPFIQQPSKMAQFIEKFLNAYPHCDLAIENVLLMNKIGELCPGSECGTTSEFIQRVKKELSIDNQNRIGTVLDTCHALSTIRIKNLIKLNGKLNQLSIDDEINQLENYFISNKGLCKIMHFNNASGLGIKKKEHGTVFEDKDYDLFTKILEFYNTYIKEADFVIEIREEDYSNSINFKKTVNQLKTIIK